MAAKKDDGFKLTLKVSPKGGVQMNGLQRFPTTLYADQWEAILCRADAIRKFIEENKKDLKTKEESAGDKDAGTAI